MCAYKLVKIEPKKKTNVFAVILIVIASLAAIAASAYVICKKLGLTCPICGCSFGDDDFRCDCCDDDCCDCCDCCDCEEEADEAENAADEAADAE